MEERFAEARDLAEQGRAVEAREALGAVLDREPGHAEAHQLLGTLLLQTGEASLAIPHLERARHSEALAVGAGLLLAQTFLLGQNFEQALAATDRVLDADPNSIDALRLRAGALLQTGQFERCVADAAAIGAASPGDADAQLLRGTCLMRLERLDAAEAAMNQARTLAADPETKARACGAHAQFQIQGRKNPQRGEALYDACLEAHPANLILLQAASAVYEQRGKPEKLTAALRRAVESAPDQVALRQVLARQLARTGDTKAAEETLRQTAERVDTPQAWYVLGTFRRELGDLDGALEALNRAAERAQPSQLEPILFAKADVLVDRGELEEAAALAEGFERNVYRHLVQGRVQLERGDAQAALDAFEAGTLAWPNNAGARFLAGLAAERVGDVERALSEYREATRADAAATDAALRAAQLYLNRGDDENALLFAQLHAARRPMRIGEAIAVAAQAEARRGGLPRARRLIGAWLKTRGPEPSLILALGAIENDAQGPAEAARAMAATGIDLADPAHQAVLRAWAQYLLDAGQAEAALRRVDAAIATHPEVADLYDIRGRILETEGRREEARKAFGRALVLEPESPAALSGLAELMARSGDTAGALELLDRAAAVQPALPDAAYRAAQIALAAGDSENAETRLSALVKQHPLHAGACNDLAWLLAERGEDLDRALRLAKRASELRNDADVLDTLGWVRLKRGEANAAVRILERAVARPQATPGMRYRLGLALEATGQSERAAATYRQALEAGSFPEADATRARLAQLDLAG